MLHVPFFHALLRNNTTTVTRDHPTALCSHCAQSHGYGLHEVLLMNRNRLPTGATPSAPVEPRWYSQMDLAAESQNRQNRCEPRVFS
jgi:hypothetical protein